MAAYQIAVVSDTPPPMTARSSCVLIVMALGP
jgi:hypothetical protein